MAHSTWWPATDTLEHARSTSRYGVWAAGFVAAITAVVATIALVSGSAIAGIDAWAYLDAVLFAAITFGIYKLSRFAAVAGLVLYVLESLYAMAQLAGPRSGIVLRIIITLAFIHAVRGTFAYRRLSASAPPTVSPTPPPTA